MLVFLGHYKTKVSDLWKLWVSYKISQAVSEHLELCFYWKKTPTKQKTQTNQPLLLQLKK